MRIFKKEIDSIQLSIRINTEDDKYASTLTFNYGTKTKKMSIDRFGIQQLTVDEAQDMFKMLIDICPKLANAIDDVLREVKSF